ncbi:tyrosine-protein phosphatase Lar-like [Lucilia cuprina]|uniref:tyrosine-protein phosphatase Lar-like n=1 Tax=Lucilia cuprina TaxID=7375 RepID=UPI001F05280A|nr:tyrosine-protein phosphatase Lar-like [Lucilia cuprina]
MKIFSSGLQIENSREEDQGKYECVAENSVGTEHSKATNLYVKVRRVPPTFSRPPEPINEVMLGSNLNLSCIAVGSPMPHVKWMNGAQDLTPENNIPIGRNIIELTNIQQSANYTCIAASSLGQIEATAVVKVQSLPTAPTDVQISEVTATSVRLEWSYKGPEDLQYYVIQYKPKNANQAFSEISGIITMFYVVRALSPYTEYEFYVIAVNNIGRGPPSIPATCTTGDFTYGGASDKTPPGFPVITQGPSTRVIEVGHTATMQCKAIGNPTPNIYWIKNQTRVDMSNPRYSIKEG